jgi:hypothetical protein
MLGAFTGLIGAVLGIAASLAAGILGGIISLLDDLVDAIQDLFSGDGVGTIALVFSTDSGATFSNKVRLERTSEPPSGGGYGGSFIPELDWDR